MKIFLHHGTPPGGKKSLVLVGTLPGKTHFESFASSSSVTCQWENPWLEKTLLVDASAVTELLFFCFRLPLVSVSHIPSVSFVPPIVSRCRPRCLFSSVNIKWPCVSVSGEPTLTNACVSVLVVHDSRVLYLSQLHTQLQCGDRRSQCAHRLNELKLSVDINCALTSQPLCFLLTEWKMFVADGSRMKAGQGGVRVNFTMLFNKALVKMVCFVHVRSFLSVALQISH